MGKSPIRETGHIRWQSVLHFYTISCIKAGFLIKEKGIWYITLEGEEALKLGEEGLINGALKAYAKWKATHPKPEPQEPEAQEEETPSGIFNDHIEQQARDSLISHVSSKGPYEFQDLAAALLRAMGYYTPFVSPRGKDGGVDIIAYRDPLGTGSLSY